MVKFKIRVDRGNYLKVNSKKCYEGGGLYGNPGRNRVKGSFLFNVKNILNLWLKAHCRFLFSVSQ